MDANTARVTPLPWDALADAFEAREDARREVELATDEWDVAVAQARLLRAEAEHDRAKEHLGALGNLMLFHALRAMGIPLQKELVDVFGGLADAAWDVATAAAQRASRALADIDALQQRVRELEEIVARLTPGVGDPAAQTRIANQGETKLRVVR